MKVKFKRNWFGPDKRRYRKAQLRGAAYVPDEFYDVLPSDAEVVEGPELKPEKESEPEKEPESEKEPDTFSEMAQRDAEALDPSAAFKRQLGMDSGKKVASQDAEGAQHAAQNAAAEKDRTLRLNKKNKKR